MEAKFQINRKLRREKQDFKLREISLEKHKKIKDNKSLKNSRRKQRPKLFYLQN